MIIDIKKYNVANDGKTNVTKDIQKIIDFLHNDDTLVISSGKYLVSGLFLKSNINLIIDNNAELIASVNECDYVLVDTRIAGVEMKWYPGILNCNNCHNVTISGKGIINGNGPYWWSKYWGIDMHGGMRKEYDAKGLRFLCDYDCMRPRNLVISNSSNIEIKDITSFESGFWNVHILYSDNIIVDNIHIDSSNLCAPSTDGIDIDSSSNIIVKNCVLRTNDDSISIKSGRDYDGIRVNRPCHDISIVDCKFKEGFGVTIGSEVSGGIYNVWLKNLVFDGTDCGFRIKSSLPRKGYIKNVYVDNIKMINVKYAFHWFLNWNPNYSICTLPNDYNGEITKTIKTLCMKTDGVNTEVSNIFVNNVVSTYKDDYYGISRAFNIEGFSDSYMHDIIFKNVNIKAKEYGFIRYADVLFVDSNISFKGENDHKNDEYDNR